MASASNCESLDARLASFKHRPASNSSLAYAGFSYTGPNDAVSCVFCHNTFENWGEDEEKLLTRHKALSPHCNGDAEMLELEDELRHLKASMLCRACKKTNVEQVTLPCGHLICCADCLSERRTCGACFALIKGTVQVYFAESVPDL